MRSEGYKPCTKCGETKPLTEFSPDRRKRDGRQSSCKACVARVSHAWRKRNPEKQRQQGRRKFAKKQRERPGAHAAKTARWRAENPEHYALLSRAHLAVAYALKRGVLQRPSACEECGAPGPIEAHHEDHSRLLEVRWLCRICHRAADKARQGSMTKTFGPYPARVALVHDGDSIFLDIDLGFDHLISAQDWDGKTRLICRVYGINAPELSTQAGKDALAYAQTLLKSGDRVTVLSHGWDAYGGRFDGQITLPDGTDFGQRMLDAGHAVPYLP